MARTKKKKKAKPKKQKRKLTAAERRAKRERNAKYELIFINGKQKRIRRRVPLIDGMPVDEFILRNADPIWLVQNEMWEYLEPTPENPHYQEEEALYRARLFDGLEVEPENLLSWESEPDPYPHVTEWLETLACYDETEADERDEESESERDGDNDGRDFNSADCDDLDLPF